LTVSLILPIQSGWANSLPAACIDESDVTLMRHAYVGKTGNRFSGRKITKVIAIIHGEKIGLRLDIVIIACGP